MEIRVCELARTPLGSASFVDLRLPEGEPWTGQSMRRDTLTIHVLPRVLRTQARPGDIQTGAGRVRINGRAHVGLLHVERAGVLYVAYLNPADEQLPERVSRIRAQGHFWICMYDLLGTFGMNQIGPIEPSFLASVLEVREQEQGVSRDAFEGFADEVDWVLKHPQESYEGVLPNHLRNFKGTVCTDRVPRAPHISDMS